MGKQRVVSDPSNRRLALTRFVVPHETFRWYTRTIAISTLTTGLLLALSMWIYSNRLYNAMGLPPMAQDPEVLAQYNHFTMLTTALVVVLGTLYITAVSAFLFHRVAGPVYRIELHMKDVLDGYAVEPLRFRDHDQLSELAETYNQLLYKLEVIEPKPDAEV
jgi:sensor histidine kinase YesM